MMGRQGWGVGHSVGEPAPMALLKKWGAGGRSRSRRADAQGLRTAMAGACTDAPTRSATKHHSRRGVVVGSPTRRAETHAGRAREVAWMLLGASVSTRPLGATSTASRCPAGRLGTSCGNDPRQSGASVNHRSSSRTCIESDATRSSASFDAMPPRWRGDAGANARLRTTERPPVCSRGHADMCTRMHE